MDEVKEKCCKCGKPTEAKAVVDGKTQFICQGCWSDLCNKNVDDVIIGNG